MKEYIEKDAARDLMERALEDDWEIQYANDRLRDIPAADVVPWEWLELYADYFWAGVSMPEFVREAKMFYESSNKAMQGGVIDG